MSEKSPLKVLVVDDEPLARVRLVSVLGDLQGQVATELVGEAANGREALALIEALLPDVVLLDVQMPGMNGIEVARHAMLVRPHPPVVIFTTAFEEFALQAFEVQAIDYLVKPVRASRLFDALERARLRVVERTASDRLLDAVPAQAALARAAAVSGLARRHISVSERGKLFLVPIGDVIYFRAELKYTTIRTRDREYLCEESLSALESEFGALFVRIHRNALVARDAIAGSVKGPADHDEANGAEHNWHIVLRGLDETLPVSRRQWPTVKALIRP